MGKSIAAVRRPALRAALIGAAGAAGALLLILLCAFLYSGGTLPQGNEALLGRISLALAALGAGFAACRGQGEGRGAAALVCGGVLVIFALLLGVFAENSSVINMSLILNILCVTFGVFAGFLLSARRRKRRRRREKR